MKRVKFSNGKQRDFLKEVLVMTNSPSLGELSRRLGLSYGTLKCYFSEKRLMLESFVKNLSLLSNINFNNLDIDLISDNWGQVLGGKKSRK